MRDPRIYLDNAATSWPKPEGVYAAMDRFMRDGGGSAGRGGHAAAYGAQAIVECARQAIAKLVGAAQPASVALMFNGTDSLNAVIHGVLRPRDHVVTTVCEHNSVLRPLRHAEESLSCEVTLVDCDDQGVVSTSAVLSAVRDETRLVAVAHASNVTGAIQPVEEICRALASSEALVLVDAAQTAGHLPIDVTNWCVDLLAASGHKGLLGPTGTGFLYVRPGVETQVTSWRRGGTGSQSESQEHPQAMPSRLEAGNPNVVGLVGLLAGIGYLNEQGIDSVRAQESRLASRLYTGLACLPGCQVYGPGPESQRVAVVSAQFDGYDSHEAAAALEIAAGVECRAGLHCAPEMHNRLRTLEGGLVRFSPGCFNTPEEIERVIQTANSLAVGV